MTARISAPPFDVTIGRQPINLATSAFFTPNDFFAPFSAETFFRLYKPGVDAARLDIQFGELSGATLVGVLGYEHGTDPRADDPIRIGASSWVAQGRSTLGPVELSVLAGHVQSQSVLGGGIQGEIFEALGIRGEGHFVLETAKLEVSFGVEHRFDSSLFLRAEFFYHGAGAPSSKAYFDVERSGQDSTESTVSALPYLGRYYGALGASYELSALTLVDLVALTNLRDGSALLSFQLTYSLLDEAEAVVQGALPIGRKTSARDIAPSEFRLYPAQATVELRLYF